MDLIPKRAAGVAARLASIYFGARILHHEVYDAEQAEVLVVALGLWLIGVPPALWLDTLRRTTRDISRVGEGDRDQRTDD